MNSFALSQAVHTLMPQARADLAELVAYRSVADPRQFPREECEKAAGWIAAALRAEGMQDVMLIDTPDGTQSVYGYLPGPEGAPTVLLYAHYDVQPPLEEAAWVTPPFELTAREDGRWYGRGAADCKGGLIMHLTALRALRATGSLPVTVKIIVEGSEEQATGGLQRYVETHPELLSADAVVIGDSGNFRTGLPSVTASLRGVSVIEVSVNTLEGDLHSGQFGGAAPDALAALIRMLDSLMDEDGNTTIDGLPSPGTWDGLEYTEDAFREDARILDGVALRGNGPIADRIWARHALTILGIECPGATGWTPSVQSGAKAVVGLRVGPGTDAAVAETALVNHLKSAAPWGARVSTRALGQGQPFQADITSPAYTAMADAMRTAYGRDMVVMGHGGSIPLCNTLQAVYPEAEILLIGLSDPQAQIHAVNESVDPAELESMSLAEALYLRNYAENFSSSLSTR
ncbi:dipeptidase [Streptomyces sp. NPDC093594]|uniref:dipeptidase n=1 Tax=Streptomyces sp. NPDC093594 TaxID=3155305 RepID=UPI003450A2B9